MMERLIEKYNVAVPRYTSYPTVPNWNTESFSKKAYLDLIQTDFAKANQAGLSLYIHLPYCESLCTYCGCNTRITVNHAVEAPYIDALIAEWTQYLEIFGNKPKIREIHLGGGTPTFFAPSELKRLIKAIFAKAEISEDASFSFEAHPSNTTEEHLSVLASIGFDRLSLGVQDFDPKVQEAINRRQTPEDVERVTDQARKLGYRSVNFDLVYGLPFQTEVGVMNAVDEVIRLRPDRIAFYSYAHVPWKRPGQRAYDENDLPQGEEKLNLFVKGRERLMEAGYVPIGFDHFALPQDSLYRAYENGTMHRNFMGYTDLRTDFLIGLGVSSISDVGTAFAQNAKSVEGYIEQVQSGELPIVKGHLLEEMESIIRGHILNLTCKHKTSWASAPQLEQSYMRNCLRKLDEAEVDGLVERTFDQIKMTELGKLFVRNICAAFDKDYQGDTVLKKYSMGV
ncbi:oxygen-independent coproporphyrinogen III oxidase [Cryomorphaceae bacterium 1068]|nr:oxygen-independent coproporphyrinogen III oxidase [Cryomorphaceae bacterium 1068]